MDLLDGSVVIPHYTYHQLQQYLSMFGGKDNYKSIKNVADEEALIYEVRDEDGMWSVMGERRVRLTKAYIV